jgi:ketosteroid isomerase-like protein
MTNNQHKELIETFYSSFIQLDAESMISCYHENIVFEDPAFGKLKGDRAKNMWRMLCASQKGKDFKVIYSEADANHKNGTARWEASYTFSKTGRRVHNKIDARFEFADGKIIAHRDQFNLRSWAGQALGLKGKLLGGTGFFRKKLQAQTNGMLDKFEQKR